MMIATNRRNILAWLGASPSIISEAKSISVKTRPPFYKDESNRAGKSKKIVTAHWQFFSLSMDNKNGNEDYYAVNYLRPSGEGNKFLETGGFIRDRPFPRAHNPSANWAVDDMITDIRMAVALGIDAFQFNINGLQSSRSWANFLFMIDAVELSGLNFKVIPCIDCVSLATQDSGTIALALSGITHRPGLMRGCGGALVVSAFAAEVVDVNYWRRFFSSAYSAGMDVEFFPVFLDFSKVSSELLELSHSVCVWAASNLGKLDSLDRARDTIRGLGKKWFAPIWAQNFRAKDKFYEEAGNSELLRRNMMAAISNKVDNLNLLTWNDYSEGSELRPSVMTNYGYYDLAGFYICWFKSGFMPKITRDVLFYFHRIQFSNGLTQLSKQKQPFEMRTGPNLNRIEVISFLTEPGEVLVKTAEGVYTFEAGSGMQVFDVPLAYGTPTFKLFRNGIERISLVSKFCVERIADYEDLLYRADSSN